MSSRLSIMYQKKPSYDIVYRHSFEDFMNELEIFQIAFRQVCLITDSRVEKLFAEEITSLLQGQCKKIVTFSFPEGEKNKNLDVVREAYTFLIQEGFGRKDIIIALGGGVVGDLAGFTAATYLRGIDFMQIPTTLLSQVDSSIGGKTGVDFQEYKNMVGAFHMPKLVYINLSLLRQLEDRQFFSGIAEVMKSALIKDADFYQWIISNMYEICERDLDVLEEMVKRSDGIKKAIVEKDPMELGDRALLNLGHTIGHALEKYKNFDLLHGECVALGCVAAAFISMRHNLLTTEEYYEIRDMFVPFYLPISVNHIVPEEIVELTKSDKKMENGTIKFILLKKVGKAVVDMTVTEEDMLAAVKELQYEDNYE